MPLFQARATPKPRRSSARQKNEARRRRRRAYRHSLLGGGPPKHLKSLLKPYRGPSDDSHLEREIRALCAPVSGRNRQKQRPSGRPGALNIRGSEITRTVGFQPGSHEHSCICCRSAKQQLSQTPSEFRAVSSKKRKGRDRLENSGAFNSRQP